MTKLLRAIRKKYTKLVHSDRPEVCVDVAAWARVKGLPVTDLYPPAINEVESHIGNDRMAEQEFLLYKDSLERPQSLVVIENAKIRYGVGFLELPDGKICLEGNWKIPLLTENPAYQRKFFFKQRYLKGNWYSFLSTWSSEYYHWFHDVLPRLETAIPLLPNDTMFLINDNPHPYQLESLKAYGITQSRLEIQPPTIRTQIQHLWFSTPIGHASYGSGKVIQQVSTRINDFFAIDYYPATQNYYISRKGAKSRRVLNEEGYVDQIKDLGFNIVNMEQFSWKEQLKIFSSAKSIMGPHGAGLTNMIFLKSHSTIYEIRTPANITECYYILAKQLNFTFQKLEASLHGDPITGDMIISKKTFSSILEL